MNTTQHLLATFTLAFFIVSTATVWGQFNYDTSSGTITITRYTGSDGDVTIPSEINGLPVTTIGGYFYFCGQGQDEQCYAGAFSGSGVTSVTIPDSVTSIGNEAFEWCTSLTTITIPDSVTSIGFAGFYDCTSLTNVTIPDSVTGIGDWAFSSCTSLTNVTIPDSVTGIGDWAFSSCTSLTHVSIGNSVTSIGVDAFMGCINLTSITIPNSVPNIGDWAFSWCTSLASVTIGKSVTNIGEGAFYGCTSLTRVYFEGNAPTLASYAFEGATNVLVYYLPGTIGWGPIYAERPTAPWLLPYPVILTTPPNFGIQTNQFGFRIFWATNASVVVEASTTLADSVWSPVSTNTLTEGWADFSDGEWTNYPVRFYRVRRW